MAFSCSSTLRQLPHIERWSRSFIASKRLSGSSSRCDSSSAPRAAHIHGAHGQARCAAAQPHSVDQRRKRFAQRRGVVVAGGVFFQRQVLAQPGAVIRREEAGQALADRAQRRPQRRQAGQPRPDRRQPLVRYRVPEGVQALDAALGRIADDQRRGDGADGRADDPVGLDAGFVQGFVDAGLVGAQGAPALQHQHHLAVAGRWAVVGAGLVAPRLRVTCLALSCGHDVGCLSLPGSRGSRGRRAA